MLCRGVVSRNLMLVYRVLDVRLTHKLTRYNLHSRFAIAKYYYLAYFLIHTWNYSDIIHMLCIGSPVTLFFYTWLFVIVRLLFHAIVLLSCLVVRFDFSFRWWIHSPCDLFFSYWLWLYSQFCHIYWYLIADKGWNC